MEKERMKQICNIFFDADRTRGKIRFEEMFEYYWQEIKQDAENCSNTHPKEKK